jgi:hypothetical protein
MADLNLLERKYNREKEELITNLLKTSLKYALEANKFDEETYFIEDVTTIIADYEMLILKMVNELIHSSIGVVKQFSEKYSTK